MACSYKRRMKIQAETKKKIESFMKNNQRLYTPTIVKRTEEEKSKFTYCDGKGKMITYINIQTKEYFDDLRKPQSPVITMTVPNAYDPKVITFMGYAGGPMSAELL